MPSLTLLNLSKNRYLGRLPSGNSKLISLQYLNISDTSITELAKELKALSLSSAVSRLEKLENVLCFHLNSLHRVKIKACHKLREVTWLVFAPYPKVIQIEKCMEMEKIISVRKLVEVPEMMANLYPFAKLQSLGLQVLPKLKSVHWNELPSPHVREIFVSECPILKKISIGFNNGKESKIAIEGEEHSWNELDWEDEAALNAFLPCFGSI
ncbi:hypothetical protein WN944_022494 [Citrus x changshan-huyou]|uniref:Disease resistance protein n=1 Tax=Citrus x changshan-huyou TaxID=2935761 RepID=A0AAP0R383_9ROSI